MTQIPTTVQKCKKNTHIYLPGAGAGGGEDFFAVFDYGGLVIARRRLGRSYCEGKIKMSRFEISLIFGDRIEEKRFFGRICYSTTTFFSPDMEARNFYRDRNFCDFVKIHDFIMVPYLGADTENRDISPYKVCIQMSDLKPS